MVMRTEWLRLEEVPPFQIYPFAVEFTIIVGGTRRYRRYQDAVSVTQALKSPWDSAKIYKYNYRMGVWEQISENDLLDPDIDRHEI